jgi:hypothetical protein
VPFLEVERMDLSKRKYEAPNKRSYQFGADTDDAMLHDLSPMIAHLER